MTTDPFLSACGVSDPLMLEIEGPGFRAAERRTFPGPFALIGRDDRADLLLDHDLISRRHTYLQLIDGRLFFVDLESRTGTNTGEAAVESGWLAPGESLALGPFNVRWAVPWGVAPKPVGPEKPSNPLLARSSADPHLPPVKLEFQSRTSGHSVWRMSQVLALVGSSPRCKVRLLDSKLSKLHCALLRTTRGLWVIDLLGRGGVAINTVAVKSGQLKKDDFLIK